MTMNIDFSAKVTEVLEVTDNDTGEINYLLSTEDGKWRKITQKKYEDILRGNKNG